MIARKDELKNSQNFFNLWNPILVIINHHINLHFISCVVQYLSTKHMYNYICSKVSYSALTNARHINKNPIFPLSLPTAPIFAPLYANCQAFYCLNLIEYLIQHCCQCPGQTSHFLMSWHGELQGKCFNFRTESCYLGLDFFIFL